MMTARNIAIAVLVFAGLILLGVLAWNWDPFDRRARAEARAEAAELDATFKGEAVRQVDRYVEKQTIIRERAQEAEDAVQALPGAQTPIAPERRAALCDGLSGVWDGAEVCEPDSPASLP